MGKPGVGFREFFKHVRSGNRDRGRSRRFRVRPRNRNPGAVGLFRESDNGIVVRLRKQGRAVVVCLADERLERSRVEAGIGGAHRRRQISFRSVCLRSVREARIGDKRALEIIRSRKTRKRHVVAIRSRGGSAEIVRKIRTVIAVGGGGIGTDGECAADGQRRARRAEKIAKALSAGHRRARSRTENQRGRLRKPAFRGNFQRSRGNFRRSRVNDFVPAAQRKGFRAAFDETAVPANRAGEVAERQPGIRIRFVARGFDDQRAVARHVDARVGIARKIFDFLHVVVLERNRRGGNVAVV